MNENDIQYRLDRATLLINQIRMAENVLDELFFSRPTVSVAPPPVEFFHHYTDEAYEKVSQAKAIFSESEQSDSPAPSGKDDRHPPASEQSIEYPENFGELIGQHIRRVRLDRGVTQNDLAKQTGIRRPNIARLEKGQSLPNLSTLLKVSSALQIPINDLLLF
jgi:DNA-binding XRE family transcriptional regulator